ncbi:hypothetical protein AGABI2DRAFT_178839 [Agaricus bisporus var. bisporus H97]|uniref:hypothetical protein n=1 Tax=Agaricus bisporus var. bisporus (strain H97 / ATCC MYA-4626 / FGSC 10389) TaxID=936046 RepID=UPI00029F5C55|nr:hypothetical protein AGABI2DRAFT_178839 [Agaricus bisporus var. bisporus H97]EKV46517.1 hypothetical protein AGABI2DRAFT_178839 [Agaricus bisporus var. bisporus H97]
MLCRSFFLLFLAAGTLARGHFGRQSTHPKLGRHRHHALNRLPSQDTEDVDDPGHGDNGTWTNTTSMIGASKDDTSASNTSTSSGASGPYKLDVRYTGQDFFNEWDFFTAADPTHGKVNYLSKEDAKSKKLAYTNNGATFLAVDDKTTLQPGQNRDSVRITSKKTWSSGLFIADFAQVPYGCSVWPAYWSVGPAWPTGGEIDVFEGVNNQATNQYTLHTSKGCTSSQGSIKPTGKVSNKQCATINGDNTGCGFIDPNESSYGAGFNAAGGGVFAHLWDQSGIKIWHFARNEIPQDIQAISDYGAATTGSPNPDSWGTPVAFWSPDTCDMGSHFHDHSLVFDTTLCGDWAGATYSSSGCPGTCEQAVADPSNFKNAKWKINYVSVYQPVGLDYNSSY